MDEKAKAADDCGAAMTRKGGMLEAIQPKGKFHCQHIRNGEVLYDSTFSNTVMTEGKNVALDAYLAGSAYTVVGPYMGLISAASYSAIAITDTAGQINGTNGWVEAGAAHTPTYSSSRHTCAWNAAASSAKSLSSALSFSITGTGTVKGAFLIYGTGAVNTVDSTLGKLYSAGLFSGGDRAVLSGDTLNISYTASL